MIDNQILVLLHRHRRLTFFTLADALLLYTWQSLFAALNRFQQGGHKSRSNYCPSLRITK